MVDACVFAGETIVGKGCGSPQSPIGVPCDFIFLTLQTTTMSEKKKKAKYADIQYNNEFGLSSLDDYNLLSDGLGFSGPTIFDACLETEDIIFRNCDYKDLLPEIQSKGVLVDLILTDPPYCVSRDYQLGFSNMGRSGMNYGNWDYNFDQKEWINLCSPYVKAGGSIIIFNDWKNLSYLVEALLENGFVIKDLIRWEKSNPMPRNVNSRYVMDFEVAVWAVKGNKQKWTFNKPNDIPYLRPAFRTSVLLGGKNRIHPTQKSLQVFSELIKIHSNENDIIFDPFAGSGTTAVACLTLKRKFIGCEIDNNYYQKAIARL